MPVRPIATLGNPILRRVAHDVDPANLAAPELRTLIDDLIETMIAADGVGIAAPQIGISLQVAIINHRDGPFAIINPRTMKHSLRTETDEEGCLSIPGVFGLVRRPRQVTVRYLDRTGRTRTARASGLLARVFQHEIDHLNGRLFIDRAQRITRGTLPA